MSMSRESRAMLLNVLWHHQGGSSPVGQPLRALLGIGQHDRLTDEQVSEAKWIDALLAKASGAYGVAMPEISSHDAASLYCWNGDGVEASDKPVTGEPR
jgi:hypothetical protein